MDNPEIRSILKTLGERVPPASQLILVGGGALALLGSPRLTIDIDFFGDDVHPSELHRTIMQIARELQIHIEPVPLDRFVPLPEGSDERNIRIGQFGNLEVYVADPYSMALSKLDRGLDTDLADIVFLVQNGFVDAQRLERITQESLAQAGKFDFDPEILDHLQELKKRLK
ncbi:MAG: hypothetical protein FJ010_08655 [Chloroflexi bacterium]|nr:hypothetical protein [Chloroflexota bacterium]